ncbi:hypothetical protein [Nocardia sp. NPDC058497]|uniref:hypothetical protein n=1 Tax=Nocardia sp. NPDC058497 TaxID=3346529 RepID=UPI003658E02A
MAIYLVFRLCSETDDEVVYEYAGVDHQFDQVVMIRTADHAVSVPDGAVNGLAMRVAAKAIHAHRTSGVWIRFGSQQS